MRIHKIVLEKSASALMDKAGDCFDLAKAQHALAGHQHEMAARLRQTADKQQEIAAAQNRAADQMDAKADDLDALCGSLIDTAVEIKGDTIVVQRGVVECPEKDRKAGP